MLLTQTVTLSRTPSPSNVTYFMNGPLLSPKAKWSYELRPRPHNYDKNFVTRFLYKLLMNTTPLDSLS